MTRSLGRALSAMAVLTALGCGGGGDNGSGPSPSIQVAVAPGTLTVQQGGSGTVSVTLTRGGGFSAAVNVSVTGLPTGVNLTVTPSQLTGAVTTATVTVDVAASVPAGTYTATIRASAAGVGEATTTYTLTVTAIPNYALTATPPAVTIPQGTSGTSTIGVQRTNFTGAVTLTLDSPPAGITGSFNPTPATGDQSVLTISVAPTVATGQYNLTVKGSATGPGDKTTTVTLTVSQQPDYSITTTPNALTINAGANANTTVNIARTNFTGAVTLALDAPPTGVTATFNPAAPTGTSSVATINVAGNVAPGNYTLTIKGTASGVPTSVDPGVVSEEAALVAGDRTTTVALTVAPAPDFTIAAAPTAVNASVGGTANTNVSIVRTNLTADVALSLVTPPAGITGAFTPATLTGATLTSSLVISVAGSVAPGQYQVTVQGAAGTLTKTVVVTVTVVAGPSVSLVTSPSTLTIEQGSSGQTTLTATRNNYNGNIVPSVAGNPNGMNLVFNPNPLTANTSTVTVNVGSGVPVGAYNLTITGASGAAGNPTTPLQVSVTAPTGSSITWEFCNIDDVPIKFWRQNNGTWAEVAPTVVGSVTRFAFLISSSQGGIAYTTNVNAASRSSSRLRTASRRQKTLRTMVKNAFAKSQAAKAQMGMRRASIQQGEFDTFVFLASTSELGSAAEVCDPGQATTAKRFNVTGQALSEEGLIGYGGGSVGTTSATSAYDIQVVPGTYDWLALFGPTPTIPDFEHNWAAYKVGRAETTPGAAVAVDRSTATPFVTFPFTITGATGGSTFFLSQGLESARGPMAGFPVGPLANTTGTGNLFFMAPGDRLGTDMTTFEISNVEDLGNVQTFLASTRYLGSGPPGSGTFALNQQVPPFTVSSASTSPAQLWSATGPTPTDYQGSQSAVAAVFVGPLADNSVTVTATRSWLNANGGATNFTLTQPTLPAFDPAWAAAAPLDASSIIMISSNFSGVPVAGSLTRSAIRTQMP